jgi:hypothetical protein
LPGKRELDIPGYCGILNGRIVSSVFVNRHYFLRRREPAMKYFPDKIKKSILHWYIVQYSPHDASLNRVFRGLVLRALMTALAFAFVLTGCKDITASSEKAITSFTIEEAAAGVLGEQAIIVTVPYGTNITNLSPVILFTGTAVDPVSGAAQDFTNPVTYRVAADDGSTRDYVVTVVYYGGLVPNFEPYITSFSISTTETGLTGDLPGVIDETQSTITLATQEWIGNINSLKAVFEANGTLTVGGAPQTSGVTAQDFHGNIVYRVTAKSGATKEYTVIFESPQTTGLPVMKIDTRGRSVTSKDDWFSVLNPGVIPSYTMYAPTGERLSSGTTDIKGRGNSTWEMMPKKPYALKLSTKSSLLGMPAYKRWNLLANYADKTLLRTEVAFKMGEILKDGLPWTPRSRQVQLYVNNEYQGLCQLVEAIKIDENRVDIEEITRENPQRGYILEIDYRKKESFNFITTRGVTFSCSDPDENLDAVITGGTQTLFEKIKTDVQYVEDVLFSENFTDPDNGYRTYLDVESFIDWYLVNEITKNIDATVTSAFMYYDGERKKYCMGPIWDFDIALGNYVGAGEYTNGFYITRAVWVNRLFTDPAFVSQLKTRWNAKKSEFSALRHYINERAAYIDSAQAQNFKRWDILGIAVWPNVGIFETYEGEIAYLRFWLDARLRWLDTAINAL